MMKKKIIYGSIGVAVAAGVSAGIAIPVTKKVNKKEKIIEDINLNEKAYGDVTLGTLLDDVKKDDKTKNVKLDSTLKETTKYLYDKEQEGSIELQKMWFQFRIFEIKYEIGVAKPGSTTEFIDEFGNTEDTSIEAQLAKIETDLTANAGDADALKALNDRKTVLKNLKTDKENETKEIEQKIKNIDNKTINYNDANFSRNYPKILVPVSIMRDKQRRIIADERANFINQFGTEGTGEHSWINERAKKYKGAASDEDAVENVVLGMITGTALKQSNIIIDDSFTVKHAIAENADGTKVFPFLNNVLTNKTGVSALTKTNLRDKLFFMGTESRIPTLINLNTAADSTSVSIKPGILNLVKGKHFTKLRHALLKMTQDDTGKDLPWKVSKELVIRLLKETNNGGTAKAVIDQMIDIFTAASSSHPNAGELAKDAETDAELKRDEILVNFFSDNSAGGKASNGVLGAKPALEQLQGMAPGFSIGIIEGWDDILDKTAGSNDILTKLSTNLKAQLTKLNGGTAVTGDNIKVAQLINKMSDKEFENAFGGAVRDTFIHDTEKMQLTYELTDNRLLVISKFGLHIIDIQPISSSDIEGDLKKAFQEMLDKQSKTAPDVDYSSMFRGAYSKQEFLKQLITNDSALSTLLKQKVKDADGNLITDINDIIKTLDDQIKGREISLVQNVLKGAVDPWLIDKYNKGLIDAKVDPKDIYEHAREMMVYAGAASTSGGTV